MTTQPLCRYCKKKIRKRTESRYAPLNNGQVPKGWVPQTNQIIISRQYWKGDLARVNVWDGESYMIKYGHFCSDKCAALFGRAAADVLKTKGTNNA